MTIAVVLVLSGAYAQETAAGGAAQSARRADAGSTRSAAPQTPAVKAPSRSPRGFATYYAKMLDGRRTASGAAFDNDAMVAAHPHYPFGTVVRVTNLKNGRSTEVRIVDRGPTRSARAKGVIIDLSRAAASKLGFIAAGRARVRLDVLELPDDDPA